MKVQMGAAPMIALHSCQRESRCHMSYGPSEEMSGVPIQLSGDVTLYMI